MQDKDIKAVAQKACDFYKQYYKLLDDVNSRETLLSIYAENESTELCEWNGHKLGWGDLRMYFSGLPPTSHRIDVADAQPLPGCENADSFLLVVHGSVVYDGEHTREFFQRFVVRQDNSKYYIVNDYYRWLAEKM